LHAYPHGVVAVLVAGHHDAATRACRRGDATRFGAGEGDRFFAHHVITLLEPPEGQLQVRRGRGTDVDEVDRGQVAQPVAMREERDAVDRRHVRGAVDYGDDLDARPEGAPERGQVRLPRDAPRSDDSTAVPLRLR